MGSARWSHLLELTLAWITLAVLLLFVYARFVVVPYAGLYFSPAGRVELLFVDPETAALQVGDQLEQVGPVTWVSFQENLRQQLYEGVQPGDQVPTVINRDGARLTVQWVFPGFTATELADRLNSEWPLAFAFWLAGLVTVLVVRPRDALQRVLVAFNFLTALWLITGSTSSRWHVWEGSIVLHMAVWLSMPVYLHLHWLFPKPFRPLPAVAWVLYAIAATLAILEWFQALPNSFYFIGFLVGAGGSLVLLAAHYFFQPEQRRELRLLMLIWLAALVPPLVLGVFGIFSQVPTFGGGALVGLPALPVAYLYSVYRRRFGPHEVRANRLLALYLFIILWGSLLAVVVPPVVARVPDSQILVAFVTGLVSVIVGVLALPSFQRWVERRLLGVTWSHDEILENYAEQITTSLDVHSLVNVLTGDVLPSLLIRQSALLRIDAGRASLVYAQAVDTGQLPADQDLPALVAQAGKVRPRTAHGPLPCPWARVALPLRLKDELIGLWLFGRRDPDDVYGAADIASLQTLAHQTAIALTNSLYAERLQALYRNAIDQREAERSSLSRELHDEVLQRLYALKSSAVDKRDLAGFDRRMEAVNRALAQTIRGLRPPMLEYGLYQALVALVDDWANRPDTLDATPPLSVSLTIPDSECRYAPAIELHLYRIVQQAGDNALEHAGPRSVVIGGRLEASEVELTIEDDGLGLDPDKQLDPGALEALGHFGLAGMRERAALIGAHIHIDSGPERGTRIRLNWRLAPEPRG